MKVLMVTNAVAPDKLGGLERYVRELAAALVRKGHDVTTLSKRTDPSQPSAETGDDGVRLLRYRDPAQVGSAVRGEVPGQRGQVGAAHGARRRLRRPARPLSDLDAAGDHHRIPYIYTFHAPVHKEVVGERQGAYRAPGPVSAATVEVMKRIERRVLERAAIVVTLSEFVAGEMRAITRPGSTTWKKIPGGLKTDYFTPLAGAQPPDRGGAPADRHGSPTGGAHRRRAPRGGDGRRPARPPDRSARHHRRRAPARTDREAAGRPGDRPRPCTCWAGSRTRTCWPGTAPPISWSPRRWSSRASGCPPPRRCPAGPRWWSPRSAPTPRSSPAWASGSWRGPPIRGTSRQR